MASPPSSSVTVNPHEDELKHQSQSQFRHQTKSKREQRYTYTIFKSSDISSSHLSECAELFSENYGIWGESATPPLKAGTRVRMSAKKLRELVVGDPDSCLLARCTLEGSGELVGHAFASIWSWPLNSRVWALPSWNSSSNTGRICWITQLVVSSHHRRKGIATAMIRSLVLFFTSSSPTVRAGSTNASDNTNTDTDADSPTITNTLETDNPPVLAPGTNALGIASSHPAALLASFSSLSIDILADTERYIPFLRAHAQRIMHATNVPYLRGRAVCGSLYSGGSESESEFDGEDEGEGEHEPRSTRRGLESAAAAGTKTRLQSVSSINTHFHVDHAEPRVALEEWKVSRRVRYTGSEGELAWALGELREGHEYLLVLPIATY